MYENSVYMCVVCTCVLLVLLQTGLGYNQVH